MNVPKVGEPHKHKCGMYPGGPNDGQGCGLLFEHIAVNPRDQSDEEYDRDHMCPACGLGPWKWVWSLRGQVLWQNMSPTAKAEMVLEIRREEERERVLLMLRALRSFFSLIEKPDDEENKTTDER